MLTDLFPRFHSRYRALPIFGPALDDYAAWLSLNGYRRDLVCSHVRASRRLDEELRRRGARTMTEFSREELQACCPEDSQADVGACFRSPALGAVP